MYYIWYGDCSKDKAAQTILTDFIQHYGGSPNKTTSIRPLPGELAPRPHLIALHRVDRWRAVLRAPSVQMPGLAVELIPPQVHNF